MRNKKLVLFDLDGVLLNSRENMMLSWASVQEKFFIHTPFESYFKNIGRPFHEIMDILGHSLKANEIEKTYRKTSINNIDKLSFYEDVQDVLQKLIANEYKLGIVTSKDIDRTHIILDLLDVEFSTIRTPNDICRGKPAPDHLLMALALTNTDPNEAVYIGDMDVDYVAARRAGIDFLHAVWGYAPNLQTDASKLQSFTEIFTYLEGDKE